MTWSIPIDDIWYHSDVIDRNITYIGADIIKYVILIYAWYSFSEVQNISDWPVLYWWGSKKLCNSRA